MQSSPVSKKALTTNDDELEERKESERGYRLKRNTCIVTILDPITHMAAYIAHIIVVCSVLKSGQIVLCC